MKSHNVLVTGGSGFIGNQVVHELHKHGHKVTVVDREIKHWSAPATIVQMDYLEYFNTCKFKCDTVIHLAAEHIVPHSITEPEKYYANNVVKMKAMLDHMARGGVKNIIFSSSGNVYGRQGAAGFPLKESMYYDPENPYASTKVAGEMLIKDYSAAYGIKYVNFRYFNACGADPEARFGYVQRPATHVIPILCNKILNDEIFPIYGSDYDTRDGTCIRDYVHVADLARAHNLALNLFDGPGANETFNIGAGAEGGVSVKDLVTHAEEVVGRKAIVSYLPRRVGDPAILMADITKAKDMLTWVPEYTIKDSIKHAWEWEKKCGI